MLAVDLTLITLVASGAVLALCVAAMAAALPEPHLGRRRWRRRRRPAHDVRRDVVVASYLRDHDRNPITGPRPSLPRALRSTTPARQTPWSLDTHGAEDELQRAEAVIDYLIDTDPDLLADIIMDWIRSDPDDEPLGGAA